MILQNIEMSEINLLYDANVDFVETELIQPTNRDEIITNIKFNHSNISSPLWTIIGSGFIGILILMLSIMMGIALVYSTVLNPTEFSDTLQANPANTLFVIIGVFIGSIFGGRFGYFFLRSSLDELYVKRLSIEDIYDQMVKQKSFVVGQVLSVRGRQDKIIEYHSVDNGLIIYGTYKYHGQKEINPTDFVLILYGDRFHVLL